MRLAVALLTLLVAVWFMVQIGTVIDAICAAVLWALFAAVLWASGQGGLQG